VVRGLDGTTSSRFLDTSAGASCTLAYSFEPATDGPQTETSWGMIDDRTVGIVFSGTGTGTPGTPDLIVAPDPVT
jgi:hypothetical protein